MSKNLTPVAAPTGFIVDQPLQLNIAVAAFLTALKGENRAPATIAAYASDLRHFCDWLATSYGISQPEKVQRVFAEYHFAELGEQGYSGVTRARKLAAIRGLVAYFESHEVIGRSPVSSLHVPVKERRRKFSLRREQYTHYLAVTSSSPRDNAIIQVLLQYGLRVGELCRLMLDDVDIASKILLIRQAKGARDREAPLEKKGIAAICNDLAVRDDHGRGAPQVFLNQ